MVVQNKIKEFFFESYYSFLGTLIFMLAAQTIFSISYYLTLISQGTTFHFEGVFTSLLFYVYSIIPSAVLFLIYRLLLKHKMFVAVFIIRIILLLISLLLVYYSAPTFVGFYTGETNGLVALVPFVYFPFITACVGNVLCFKRQSKKEVRD